MKKTLTILIIFLLSSATLHAQNTGPQNINRNINILERVLDELFKAEWSGKEGSASINRIHISKGDYTWNLNRNNSIEGMYLPSYGVLFTVSMSKPIIYSKNDNKNEYYFTSGDDADARVPVTEKTIENRMVDFLKNYGPTINQLKPDDKITVAYKSSDYNRLTKITGDPSGMFKKNRLPSISVTAQMDDIKAYQKDKISDQTFRTRLQVNRSKPGANNPTDLKILSNILETALQDQNDQQFAINNDIEYQQIEGLGALYSFDISYGNIFDALNINKDQILTLTKNIAKDTDLDSLDFDGLSFDSLKSMKIINPTDSALVIKFDSTYFKKMNEGVKKLEVKLKSISKDWIKRAKQLEKSQKKQHAQMQQALDKFISELKGCMLDYGNTLQSISADQYLLLSVTIDTNTGDLPEHITLQAQKSLLKKVSQGNINRQQAIQKISVREY